MASALDRLLKKYTLEDSGSGGSTGRKTLPLYPIETTPDVTLPTPSAADPMASRTTLPAGWLLAGSPEARAYYNSLPDPNEIDPVSGNPYGINSGRWRPDIYNALAPISERRAPRQDSYISGDNEIVNYLPTWSDPGPDLWEQGGAVNYAYNPQTHDIVGVDANGNLIPGVGYNAAPNDQAFWNAALLAAGLVGGAVGGAGAAGGGAGDTYMIGAAEAAVPTATDTYMLGAAGGAGAGAGASDAYMAGAAGAGTGGGSGAGAAAGTAASGLTGTPSTGTVSTPSASGSWLDDIAAWMKDPKNAEVAKLLFGATGAALGGTGGSSGGGYSYSGPMPTISRQGWAPTAQQQTLLGGPSMGMLDVKPGEAMSGLWRYGLLGGGGK